MKTKLLKLTITILTFFAFTNAVSACGFGTYQPEIPKQLKDK